MRVKRFDIVFEVVISGSAGGMCGLSGEVRQWYLHGVLVQRHGQPCPVLQSRDSFEDD
jgi:hypothetical protein